MIVASLGFFSSTAEAVIIVGPDGVNPYEDINYTANGSNLYTYYEALSGVTKNDLPGTLFLETSRDGSGQSEVITGYNDAGGDINNASTNSSQSLTLAQAGSLSYNQQNEYVRFLLSANQRGTEGEDFYKVGKLEIYTSKNDTFDLATLESSVGNGPDQYTLAYAFEATGTEIYGDDETGDGALALQYTTGNSNWDVALYVPLVNFEEKGGSGETTFIHFIVEYEDNAGFDTWSVAVDSTLIPEPSSAILISLAGLMGLLRRRR